MTMLTDYYVNLAQQQIPLILTTHLSVNSILPFLPDYFFVLSILNLSIFFVLSLTNSKQFINFDKINQKNVGYLSILTVLLYFFLISKKHFIVIDYSSFNCFVYNNFFTVSLKIFVIISVLIYLILSHNYLIENRFNIFEYYVLVLTSTLGFLLLISSNELIITYLSIEIQSLVLYVLAASKTNSSYSTESGIKYFILGSTSSIIFLFGTDLIYGLSGSLMMTDFSDLFLWFFSVSGFFSLCPSPPSVKLPHYLGYFDGDTEEFLFKIIRRHWLLGPEKFYITEAEFFLFISEVLLKIDYIYYTTPVDDYRENLLIGVKNLMIQHSKFRISSEVDRLGFDRAFYNIEERKKLLKQNSQWATILDEPTLDRMKEQQNNWRKENDVLIPEDNPLNIKNEELHKFLSDHVNGSYRSWVSLFGPALIIDTVLVEDPYFGPYSSKDAVRIAIKDASIRDNGVFGTTLIELGLLMILISLFIKLALSPFHLWSPDVYEGSPMSSAFFFMVISKISIFVLLLKICYISFYSILVNWQFYTLFVAFVSIFVGSVGGLQQRKIKSLLAYSSISNMGLILASFSTGNFEGVKAFFYYFIIYTMSGLAMWAILLLFKLKKKIKSEKYNIDLGDFSLLRESNEVLAYASLIILFSIAGIPPMLGFLAKVNLFLSLIESAIYFVALLSIIMGVVSTFFYLRVLKVVFFENDLVGKLFYPMKSTTNIIRSILFFLPLFLFYNPSSLNLFPYKISLFSNKNFF